MANYDRTLGNTSGFGNTFSKTKNSKTAFKKSQADKFSELFDNDWSNSRSLLMTQKNQGNTEQYQGTFSTLPRYTFSGNNPDLPLQTRAPIALAGTAVIPLESSIGYNSMNISHEVASGKESSGIVRLNGSSYTYYSPPNSAPSGVIPISVSQQDLGMPTSFKQQIPLVEEANKTQSKIIIESKQSYANQGLVPPKFKVEEVPASVQKLRMHEKADSTIANSSEPVYLTPKERREAHEWIQKNQEANKIIKENCTNRNKTYKILTQGQLYRNGIIGVDYDNNIDSEIYGKKSEDFYVNEAYKIQIKLERHSNLNKKFSSIRSNGNIIAHEGNHESSVYPINNNTSSNNGFNMTSNAHNPVSYSKVEKPFQSKCNRYHDLTFEQTKNRLFCRLQGGNTSERTQRLRDIELRGRENDLINHTVIENWPSRQYP